MDRTPAPIFRRRQAPPSSSAIPSSSPAFGTPVHPLKPFNGNAPRAAILPIILPPATLRPLAFRTFTKKHSLTLSSSALQELAAFIGRHCGSGWREEGLAERVLEEVARGWKNRNGGIIVEGTSQEMRAILKTMEGNMSGGRIVGPGKGLPRGDSILEVNNADTLNTRLGLRPSGPPREDSNASFGMSGLNVGEHAQDEGHDDEKTNDLRAWLTVINAFEQPRLLYNVGKKHFERETSKPSLLPPASHKTTMFRNRYQVIHQRLLRSEAFQTSTVASSRQRTASNPLASQQSLKITPVANMLGRHGSSHMLLGQLVILPTGNLAISDLTGSIPLDLTQAVAIPEDSAWFCPGMVVLVDGVYEEEEESVGKGLSGSSGVGGTLGGKFQGFFIGQPPCERRQATLGMSGPEDGGGGGGGGGGYGQQHAIGGGFGWIDFLGVGSKRAVGAKMQRLERRLMHQLPSSSTLSPPPQDMPGRGRAVIIGELNLDQPRALQAMRRILSLYAAEPEGSAPLTFVLTGNFTHHAVMAHGGSGGSIEYKEYFDALASALSDFPTLLQSSTFVFVPGDNDGWISSFTAGASVPLPRKPIPDMFTSRIRRVFAAANAEAGSHRAAVPGSAVWTSNPSRITLFGPNHEVVLFRDDISARLRRTAVPMKKQKPSETNPDSAAAESGESATIANADSQDDAQDQAHGEPMDLDPDPFSNDAEEEAATSTGNAIPGADDVRTAQKLVKTILDQGYLAPFRQSIRPVHWDYSPALHLYPLPTAMILVDTTAPPFCITYEGCHVMNPSSVLVPGRKGIGRWVEYEIGRQGTLRECTL